MTSENSERVVAMSRPQLGRWSVVKPYTDGIIKCENYCLDLYSPKFTRSCRSLDSHFKTLVIYGDTYQICKPTHFEWIASGEQYFECGVPEAILCRSNNVQADPRLGCGAVLLLDTCEDIIIGFLFTNQMIYAISGRHPIPCFETYEGWWNRATLDEYAQMRAFGEWSDKSEQRHNLITWQHWLKKYDPLCLQEEYAMWKKRTMMEPDWWDDWRIFRNCDQKAHLGIVELMKREDKCTAVRIAIDVDPCGAVIWSINGLDLFKQPFIGTRLLDRYAALELGGCSKINKISRLQPALATMTFPDLVLPEHHLDPIFPVIKTKNYYSPIRSKDGGLYKLGKKAFLCDGKWGGKEKTSELFGQGASVSIRGTAFDSILLCDRSRIRADCLAFEDIGNCVIEESGKIDLRKYSGCGSCGKCDDCC